MEDAAFERYMKNEQDFILPETKYLKFEKKKNQRKRNVVKKKITHRKVYILIYMFWFFKYFIKIIF